MAKLLFKNVLSVLLVLTLTVGMFACAVSVSANTYEPVINGFSSDAWTVGSNGSINENGEFVGNYTSPYWLPTSIVSNESYDLSAGFNFSSLINWAVPQDNTAANGGYGWWDSSFARITIGNISVLMIHKAGDRAYTVDVRYTDDPDTLASAGHIIQNGGTYGDGSAWNSYGTRLGYQYIVGYNDSNHVENVHQYLNGIWSINYDGTNLTVSLDATAGETYDLTLSFDISGYVEILDFKSSKIVMERDNVIFKESTALSSYTVMDDIYLEKNAVVGCAHEFVFVETVNPTCTEQGYSVYECSLCGETYNTDYVEGGHTYGESIVVEATCTHMGYTCNKCSVCGAETDKSAWVKAKGHTLTNNGGVVTCSDCDLEVAYSGTPQTYDFYTNDYTGQTGYLTAPAVAFVGDTINHPNYKRGEAEGWCGDNKFTFYGSDGNPVCNPTAMYRWWVYYEGTAESDRVTEEFNADTARDQTYTFTQPGTYYIRGCLNNTNYWENVATIEVFYVTSEHEHIYSSEVTKEPTSTSVGERTYTCTLCGTTYTEEIPMLQTFTWSELNVLTDEGGTILIDDAAYDESATAGDKTTHKVTAVPDELHNFVAFVDADGNVLTTESSYEFVVSEDIYIRATYAAKPFSDWSVTATDGGKVLINGAEVDTTASYLVGTVVSISAVADTGYTFSHWANEKGGIVTTDETVTVALALKSVWTAVFTKDISSAGDSITVSFRDHAGNIISSSTTTVGTEITLPSAPYAYGYTFTGWNVNGTVYAAGATVVFTGDTIVSAAFEKVETVYSVKVSGAADAISGTYTYNTLITAVFDTELLDTNEIFAGWSNGTAVVSYDEEYTFFVGADVKLTALVSTTAAEIAPIINVTDVSVTGDGKLASFLTERWLPDDYTLVEAGTVYTNDANASESLTLENVNGTNIRKATTKFMTNDGQFRLNLGSKSGAGTFYVTAFLAYVDANGAYNVIYTSVYSESTTAANA